MMSEFHLATLVSGSLYRAHCLTDNLSWLTGTKKSHRFVIGNTCAFTNSHILQVKTWCPVNFLKDAKVYVAITRQLY